MQGWITSLIESLGYVGIAFLMLIENVFPPIPSEIVMPAAGLAAARGELNIVGVVIAGTVGTVLGAWFWYEIARWFGGDGLRKLARRYGRWITFHPEDVGKLDGWFHRYSKRMVFFGRLVPTVRTLISVPAGVFEMPRTPFLLLTSLGSLFWTGALAAAGYILDTRYEAVGSWLSPVSMAVIVGLTGLYVYRVATFEPKE